MKFWPLEAAITFIQTKSNVLFWARRQLLIIYEVWTRQIMCFAGNCLSGFHQTK